jgi:DNA polymerase-3 subunit beta
MSPGSCTVNYKELMALIKPLKHQVLKLTMQEKTLSIEASGFTAPLSTMDASEYPAVPSVDEKTRIPLQSVTLPVATFRRLVNLVEYAAADDYTRPVFASVLVNLTDHVLEMAAADAFRLSVARETIPGSGSWPCSLLIPASELHKVIGKLPKQGVVTLSTESSAHTTITCGDLTVYIRLTEGNFPNFNMIIPRETAVNATIDTQGLKMALQSVKGIVQDSSNITRLHLNGSLEVKATRDGMEKPMSVHVDALTSGQEMDILLNWKYINDVLAVNPGREIQMGFNMPGKGEKVSGKPVRVTFPDVPGFVGVLMPMHNSR